ncbi:hypothetical protein [Baaleninema sp.]|uniref:hypothetical protein n=1 Tax=Baaleninema sp. TaxID=3101197 RepID=UPI003D000F0E
MERQRNPTANPYRSRFTQESLPKPTAFVVFFHIFQPESNPKSSVGNNPFKLRSLRQIVSPDPRHLQDAGDLIQQCTEMGYWQELFNNTIYKNTEVCYLLILHLRKNTEIGDRSPKFPKILPKPS